MIVLSLGMMSLAFIIAAVAGIFVIPFLHRLKFGQEIREEGPAWNGINQHGALPPFHERR